MKMHTLIAVWSAPDEEDREAFEKRYVEEHAPKAAAVPNLQKLVTSRTAQGLEGSDSAFYRVAEMVFESAADLHEAEASEAWTALREDAGELVEEFDVTMQVGIGERTLHEGDD
jgi:uncharacterized protein (TIGR02118 family)